MIKLKKKELKIKKKAISNDKPQYCENDIEHISNDRIDYLRKIMGLSNKNNFMYRKPLSINKRMRIPNKIQNCSSSVIRDLKSENEIFYFDNKTNEEIVLDISKNHNELLDFYITIQPNVSVSKERMKDLFTLFLCKWGYFLYGRKYPEKLKDKFIVFFEKNNYEHIHLLLMDFRASNIELYVGYMYRFFDIFFNDCFIYPEIADNRENVLLYSIKKDDTIIMTNEDFKK